MCRVLCVVVLIVLQCVRFGVCLLHDCYSWCVVCCLRCVVKLSGVCCMLFDCLHVGCFFVYR